MEQVEQSLRAIEAAAHAGMVKTREMADCGPFRAYFDPLMVCTRETFQPRAMPDLRIQELRKSDDDATLTTFVRTATEGFAQMDQPMPIDQQLQRLRVELQADRRFGVIGWIRGEPAGVAALSPMDTTAELVGVATLPRFRNRGVARAL